MEQKLCDHILGLMGDDYDKDLCWKSESEECGYTPNLMKFKICPECGEDLRND